MVDDCDRLDLPPEISRDQVYEGTVTLVTVFMLPQNRPLAHERINENRTSPWGQKRPIVGAARCTNVYTFVPEPPAMPQGMSLGTRPFLIH